MKPILDIRGRGSSALLLLASTALLGACANLNSIHRSTPLPGDQPNAISIDAKQRMILSSPVKQGNARQGDPLVRFCAEPPPDVFTAIASSLGIDGSLSGTDAREVAAKFRSAMAENAATVERTQTVNILREMMYRTCERFLGGAISEDEFIVQSARDQQMIVQVLALEQITGVVKAQSTALTTVARAAGGIGEGGLATVADARKDLDEKSSASSKAASEANALAPVGPCSSPPLDEKKPPDGVTADQAKAKNAKCTAAARAKTAADEAREYYEIVKKALDKQDSLSSEALGKLSSAVLTASSVNNDIAGRVVEIVRQRDIFDEVVMTCVVTLRRNSENAPGYCKNLIEQMAETRSAQLAVEKEHLKSKSATLMEMQKKTNDSASVVWEKLGRKVEEEALQKLLDTANVKLSIARKKELIAAGTSWNDFLRIFSQLARGHQISLEKAAASQ